MRRSFSLLPLIALAACTVGPNYAGPAPIGTSSPAFVRGGDAGQAVAPGVARWWTALGDSTLDAIEEKALAANADIAIARARLRQARASARLESANALPKVTPTASYAHVRVPGVTIGGTGQDMSSSGAGTTTDLDLYNLGFDASWEVDLFGGRRRAVQAARATAEAAEADLADAQVSLAAEVAQAYVALRDRQRRIDLADRGIVLQERMLSLTRQRYARGTASRIDVAALENMVEVKTAEAPPLKAERDSYLDMLATLIGERPGPLDADLAPARAMPLPPSAVAVGDPADLLRRRPDIRAAERRLAAGTAKIGQAEAERFPKLNLTGIIGIGGTSPGDVTHLDNFFVLAAPQLSWNFLDFGRNKARVVQAKGARDEADARYRSTVLAALRDAEDALSRFRNGRIAVATLARAKAKADEAMALSEERYRAGTTTMIDVLDTRTRQIDAEQSLARSEAGLTQSFIAIQKALGFGWTEPSPPRHGGRQPERPVQPADG